MSLRVASPFNLNVEARPRPGGAGEVAPNANHATHKEIRERVEG